MKKNLILIAVAIALTACVSHSPVTTPIDQIPLYGGVDRASNPRLKAGDDQLIEGTVKEFGSREKASEAFVGRGFRLYQEDDLAGATRRFNQAWILNPSNPEVYWGFSSVLHDQGKNCEAMEMAVKALDFHHYISGLYPDAARVIVLCSLADTGLTPEGRELRFKGADELYAEAAKRDTNKGYVFASWATAYYWRGKYADAWRMVTKAHDAGQRLPERFLSLLKEKMPEPKR